MMTLRSARERGHSEHSWLDSKHTFSFADYYDTRAMGYRSLRVINDDRVAPGQGFGTHGHRDMEIVTYVLEGALEHKDNIGNGSVIRPGDVQRMSAGTGVLHSEFNASKSEPVHFLQIWILPEQNAIAPGYEQKTFPLDDVHGKFTLVASRDGRAGSVRVHQDVSLYAARFRANDEAAVTLAPKRRAWVHIARGAVKVNGVDLREGDGAALEDEASVAVVAREPSEVLVFDLA